MINGKNYIGINLSKNKNYGIILKWICIMRMLEFKRTKLFDGVEYELFNKEFLLNIEGKSLSFIADDITQFKLIDYQGKQEIIYELLQCCPK